MRSKAPAAVAARIRIAVLEEHELFRAGLCLLLSQQLGFEVVADAGRWPDMLPIIEREQPDADVMLLAIGDSIGIDPLPDVAAASEDTKILVLSKSNDQKLQRQAVCLGAAGVLSRDKATDVLIKAIERIYAGEAWLDRFTTASLLRELSPRNKSARQDPDERKIAALTEREREVIKLVGKGCKNKQIGETLFISDITVHHHLTSIYSKLEVADRLELLIYAYRNNLAELPR
jgi:two-component system, NarL family, nitrate/nitrite response regulator NarL